MGFKAFLELLRISLLKLGLFFTKLGTQHFLVYIIFLKWLELKIIVICQKLRFKLRFYGFLSVFDTFAHIIAQTWIVLHETCTKQFLVNIIVLKWLEFIIIVICQKIRVKLRFYRFLSVFGTFSHKVAQTWFVLHETWHTKLFHVYYCVEVVRIKNHSHMLEITG